MQLNDASLHLKLLIKYFVIAQIGSQYSLTFDCNGSSS